ncbi:MAG: S1-like domain-containing RNA-binding protein [Campylobacterota bacterium]|nr:S1-like domain-containing RNA-binding protein [Campylobacterota bacterium]
MQINEHLELGVINRLVVDRSTVPGLFLMAEDEKDVLLPNQYVTDEMEIGSEIDVFVYTDSEDRIVATTIRPKAMLNEFGFFEVVDTTRFGAFVDWGLPKDLFVPRQLQKTPFNIGDKRILHVSYDEQTHRLIGEEKITKYLTHKVEGLHTNTQVNLLVIAKTPLGFKVIVNNQYEGMLFHNEIFEPIQTGDSTKGYVKMVRPDGNLDISLQPIGAAKSDAASEKVMQLLLDANGMLPYNYKSDAELIKQTFGLSKKNFKRALTKLQDDAKIEVKETGIYLKS